MTKAEGKGVSGRRRSARFKAHWVLLGWKCVSWHVSLQSSPDGIAWSSALDCAKQKAAEPYPEQEGYDEQVGRGGPFKAFGVISHVKSLQKFMGRYCLMLPLDRGLAAEFHSFIRSGIAKLF